MPPGSHLGLSEGNTIHAWFLQASCLSYQRHLEFLAYMPKLSHRLCFQIHQLRKWQNHRPATFVVLPQALTEVPTNVQLDGQTLFLRDMFRCSTFFHLPEAVQEHAWGPYLSFSMSWIPAQAAILTLAPPGQWSLKLEDRVRIETLEPNGNPLDKILPIKLRWNHLLVSCLHQ